MCHMNNCPNESSRWVTVKATGGVAVTRLELCAEHLQLAADLADEGLTRILDYGPLGGGPRR